MKGVTMRLVRIGLLAGWVVSMVGVGVGCQNKLAEENRQFREQNRELQAKLDERNALSQQPPPLGVDANHVTAEGFGDIKPKDPAKTSAVKAKNRRVEIVVVTR